MSITAVYPGTFDPVTLGHLGVIERASRLFDALVVGVGNNPAKQSLFTLEERVEMMRQETSRWRNVTVRGFDGLVVNFARECGAPVILRGIRTAADLEYEVQMAFTNRASAGVETIFIAPSPDHAYLNARFIKEIAGMGGDVSKMVSPRVARRLKAKYGYGASRKSRGAAS